jgi:hypothetical protein
MEIEHVLQECRIEAVLESVGVKSQSSKDLFQEQAKRWSSNFKRLRARSDAWKILKGSPGSNASTKKEAWLQHLPALLEHEVTIRSMDPATASESQKEDWSQILFTGEWDSVNFIPFILMYVALSKIFLAPMIAWSMPFMSFILPFLALKFVYGLPITWEMYWQQMSPMIFGRGGQEITLSTLLQWGSMLFSYAHGMYLPYTNAVHCYKIDQLMIKGSKAVVDTLNRLRDIADTWQRIGLKKPWSFPDPLTLGDDRQILAWLVKDPHLLPQIYRAIGQVELTAAFCESNALVPVEWSESVVPMCKMVDAIDPLLEESKRVPFTLMMSQGQHHAICTGPNRGGKSTFLRSALTNLVLAHTWGVAFAGQCKMTPVEWIISSLRLEDRPGQASLFEREVTVAGDIVKLIRANKTRGWVIIDELFHTTNPPDAATASQVFLRQLWSSGLVTSIVSTHLFSHAECAPAQVQRLCVDSGMDEATGQIIYKYQVTQGINTMSSVRELLVESGVVM